MGPRLSLDVAFLAEFAVGIGTGHVVESMELAAAAATAGLKPAVIVSVGTPPSLVARATVGVETVSALTPAALAGLAEGLAARGARIAVTNFRAVIVEQVHALTRAGLRVVCIDELGGRTLDCAAVINPSPITSRCTYGSRAEGFAVYAGPAYLPLSAEYARLRNVRRHFSGGIQRVVVTMGGVDRTGATLRIVEALSDWTSKAERHVVVGAAFARVAELDRLLQIVAGRWQVHRGLPLLAELLAEADAAITAGGNTLHELACVGTPALILYEDPHEAEQGRAFAAQGFGVCPGAGADVPADEIRQSLDRFEDPLLRQAMSDAGKRLVDGRGAERICDVIGELIRR